MKTQIGCCNLQKQNQHPTWEFNLLCSDLLPSHLLAKWKSRSFPATNWRERQSFTVHVQLKHFLYWNTWSWLVFQIISKSNCPNVSDYIAFTMVQLTHETSLRSPKPRSSSLIKQEGIAFMELTGFAWRYPVKRNIQRAILKHCFILIFWKAWLQLSCEDMQ